MLALVFGKLICHHVGWFVGVYYLFISNSLFATFSCSRKSPALMCLTMQHPLLPLTAMAAELSPHTTPVNSDVVPFAYRAPSPKLATSGSMPGMSADVVFIAICGLFAGLGFKSINSQDGGIGSWIKSIFVNETWMSLADPDLGGWFKTMGFITMVIVLNDFHELVACLAHLAHI